MSEYRGEGKNKVLECFLLLKEPDLCARGQAVTGIA